MKKSQNNLSIRTFFKILFIIFTNLLILIVLFLTFDYSLYYYNVKTKCSEEERQYFKYTLLPEFSFNEINSYFNGIEGRKPDGLEYSNNNSPIVIFGCSFALGLFLKYNQTFSYKLAHVLKCPVYNRAISGSAAPLMLWQVKEKESEFYNQVPPCDTVFFVFIEDHYRRNYVYNFDINSPNSYVMIHYKFKNNNFLLDTSYKNNFLKASYTYLFFHHKYVRTFVNNLKNKDNLINLQTMFLIESKKQLEEHWNKKINFVVIIYDDTFSGEELKNKLEHNGFYVIDKEKITKENLDSEKYRVPDGHPNEAAWDLLTPLIVDECKKKNIL